MPLRKLLMTAILAGSLLSASCLIASESAIQSILESSQAVVGIRAEGAGFFGGRSVYFQKAGAGVIIDPAGMIVTNAHIVQQGGRITVTLFDETEIQGEIVQLIPEQDVALIRVSPPNPLPYLMFSDSDRVAIGHKAYTIGNSTFVKGSLNGGEISGIGTHRDEKAGQNKTAILQVNFNLYQGDSGCPVMDEQGKLIGLVAAAQANRPDITFAIPSNIIKQIYQDYVRLNGPLEYSQPARNPNASRP